MSINLEPPPYDATLIEGDAQRISKRWWVWLTTKLITQLLRAVFNAMTDGSKRLVNQGAAIASTTLLTTAGAGLFRVSWYVRITTADAVSSSVTVTISWTDVTGCSKTFTAITGNTTTTTDSGSVTIRPGTATAIKYSTAYASNTPGVMRHSLELSAEQVA